MDSIGRYTLMAEIGRGGMATVYRAYDPQFDREVAIKVLPPQFMHDPFFAKRFYDEARTIARLEHRCILPVYDFGEANDMPYIVMRLMSHGSLSDEIHAAQPISFARVAFIVTQVADALDYAHGKNIIHRDLKPANLLLDQAGNIYLSDFGLAKIIGESQQATGTMVAGTPAYMAPEQALGQMPTARTDVYALGALTFQLLTGSPPFEAPNILALMYLHAHERLPQINSFRPDVPPGIQTVIEQAMAKDPSQRPASAGELANAIVSQLGQAADTQVATPKQNLPPEPVLEPNAGISSITTGSGKPRRRLVMVVLGLIGLGLCIVALGALSTLTGAFALSVFSSSATPLARATAPAITPTLSTAQTLALTAQASGTNQAKLTGTGPAHLTQTAQMQTTLTLQAGATRLAQANATQQAQFTSTGRAELTEAALLQPTLTAQALQTAAAAAARGRNVTVVSNQPWQNAGISVSAGNELVIDYIDGQWTTCGPCGGGYSDGAGRTGASARPIVEFGGCNFMSLVARIGDTARILCVGNHFDARVQTSGDLMMQVADNTVPDNQGQIIVRVIVR